MDRVIGSALPRETTFGGPCAACGIDHVLGEGRAGEHALEIMDAFRGTRRLDYEVPEAAARPRLRAERLWEPEGRMFGVLEAEAPAGHTIFLKAFSSLAGGIRWVPGWVPPLVDRPTRARRVLPVERRIKHLSRRLDRLPPGDGAAEDLLRERRELSRVLNEDLHDLRTVMNRRGPASVREAFAGNGGIPGGTGECCAPKLLTHAARLGLRPRGIVEFFWGGATPSENRVPGRFYPPCENRCRPLLGFLLCGAADR